MGSFAPHLVRLVLDHGYLAIFLIMAIEEAGVPLPIPGDGLLLFAGYLTVAGPLSLGQSLLVIDAGALLGASVLFTLAHRGGRPLLLRHGRLLHIDTRRLDQLMNLFRRLGPFGPGICRLIPGLRIYSSALAGLALVGYRRFLWNVAWACSVWALVFLVLGRVLGQHWRDYSHISGQATFYAILGLGLLGGGYWLVKRRPRRRPEPEAAAAHREELPGSPVSKV
jgi:membrane protein DedA with SNARE-associated domain